MPGLRICRRCGKEKSIEEFHKDKSIDGGFRWQCKECRRADFRKYEKRKRQENPNYCRERKLKFNKYTTVEEYNKLLDEQQGCCAICGKEETTVSRWGTLAHLSIDHNHKTGKIRGLLCMRCNHLLGHSRDNINILFKAIQYLRKL